MSSNNPKHVRKSSEAEAWKLMMDSMVRFISASTKLMQTINNRAEFIASPTGSSESNRCEVECLMCPTNMANECGVCAAAKTTTGIPATEKGNIVNQQEQIGDLNNTQAETEKGEVVEEETKEGEANEEGAKEEANEEAAEEGEGKQEEGDNPVEPVPEPAVADIEKPSEPVVPEQSGDSQYCVCTELRQIKEAAAKAGVKVDKKHQKRCKKESDESKPSGKCSCSKSAKCGGNPNTTSAEGAQMCACEVGSKEKEQMTNQLESKLNQAQENLAVLQQELNRLRYLEANKNSQSAALYKEIMKESALDKDPLLNPTGNTSGLAGWCQPKPPNRSFMDTSNVSKGSSRRGPPVRRKLQFDEESCTENSCPQKPCRRGFDRSDMWEVPDISNSEFGPRITSSDTNMETIGSPAISSTKYPNYQSQSYSTYYNAPPAIQSQNAAMPPPFFYTLDNTMNQAAAFSSCPTPENQPSSTASMPGQLNEAFQDDLSFMGPQNPPAPGYNSSRRAQSAQRQRPMNARYTSSGSPHNMQQYQQGRFDMSYSGSPRSRKKRPTKPSSPMSAMESTSPYQNTGTSPVQYRDLTFETDSSICTAPCSMRVPDLEEPADDYLNPDFETESQDFTGEGCYDEICDSECYT